MDLPYQVRSNGFDYTILDDATLVYSAVIIGEVTDEVLGAALDDGLTVTTDRPDLASDVKTQGLYAVAGYAKQVFPRINTMNYSVNVEFSAPGFASQTLSVAIPQNTLFPVLAPVALRRLPVQLQGRVVKNSLRTPIPGALVTSGDSPQPSAAPPALALRVPLAAGHPSGATVQAVTLAVVGSAQLQQPAAAGTTVLDLSTRTGLAPGVLVQVANGSQTLLEYGVVDHLGAGNASQAGQVFLTQPLIRSYGADALTTIQFFTAALTGVATQLTDDADVGDGVLLAAQWLTASTLVVDPNTPAAAEYHELGALTDADGYYALGGLGRVASLFLYATQGALNQVVEWHLEFDQPVNVVDFRL